MTARIGEVPELAVGSTLAPSGRQVDSELIGSLCALVRDYLEKKAEALNEEVRNYPRPIARCDDQLTGLLESRARTLFELERLRSLAEQDLGRADGIALVGKLLDALLDRPDV
jgi:hypothetical protein